MSITLTFQQQAVIWGHAFEVFVKRGVLGCLADWKLLAIDQPELKAWRETSTNAVYRAVLRALDIIDETTKQHATSALRHLSTVAYGLGYTATREYLKHLEGPIESKRLGVKAIWCPLTLPGETQSDRDTRRAETSTAFHSAMRLPGMVDLNMADKGMPAQADFLLWLSGSHKEDHLLVQEYSYDMPFALGNFQFEDAHLEELLKYRRLVDSRGVFARVSAEVEKEQFELSKDLHNHLGALTTDNKPFYKLCQGAGYAESSARLLATRNLLTKTCVVRALAITPNGLESLAAEYTPAGAHEPRFALMQQMGQAYRQAVKVTDGDEEALAVKAEEVFTQVLSRLPKGLRAGIKGLRKQPSPGEDYRLEFEEQVPGFANPMTTYSRAEAMALVPESGTLTDYLGQSARAAVEQALTAIRPGLEQVSLRDVHAAATVAGLKAAKRSMLNVLALEGNPGIGKTTAVTRYLATRPDGYLFLYVSPRVVINRDVTEKLARKENGEPSGIMTVTTNAQIISAAERYYASLVAEGKAPRRDIEAAVVVDGVKNLTPPTGSVLVITPEEEHEIEQRHAGTRFSKKTLSENEDLVEERLLPGVLAAMATTTRELLSLNERVTRTVLTAALQGFRERENGKYTIEALSELFREHHGVKAVTAERRRMAEKMPTVVVMVDELAGDGAGAPFVHAVAEWLKKEFIDPFDEGTSPFTVILVVSDASLGNEVVLDRYLNAGNNVPDKVLVSRSRGREAFSLAVSKVRIGVGKPQVLHVMTNSYPAKDLTVRYRVNLTAVGIKEHKPGILETPRQAVRRHADQALLQNAANEIRAAVDAGAEQVIYFAQDKNFLRTLQNDLAEDKDRGLNHLNVAILDSSVTASRRKALVSEATRDTIKVFLMTSSGARGVSFPKTDWIIAAVPRFNVEAALMEIAQLIYRGRGMYHDETGKEISGDNVSRKLVMVVDDFLVHEGPLDKRQWLRQSLDLMTLLVMLRATLFTRITGDAGLRHSLALVPVGGVGLEELLSLMSQYVTEFITEADTFVKGGGVPRELANLVGIAKNNCVELFSRFRLLGLAKKGADSTSFVRADDAREFFERASSPVALLLPDVDNRPEVPAHVYFAGPLVLENWAGFDKHEMFSFEGHRTDVLQMSKELYGQLKDIDQDDGVPSKLRVPAANLRKLLAREKYGAANEFSTLKPLKSPNTWVALPAAYIQFVRPAGIHDERIRTVMEPDLWRDSLGRVLAASGAVMPAIPRYDTLPWAAGVGHVNPLRLETVFDDRYFLSSNELNLLNTLLLVDDNDASPAVAGGGLGQSAVNPGGGQL